MKVNDIMNHDAHRCGPKMSITEIACQMRDHDLEMIAICAEGKLLGIITDRVITLHVVADGLDSTITAAGSVMTTLVNYCFTTDSLETAMEMMRDQNLKSLMVLDHQLILVGMISHGVLTAHLDKPKLLAIAHEPAFGHTLAIVGTETGSESQN